MTTVWNKWARMNDVKFVRTHVCNVEATRHWHSFLIKWCLSYYAELRSSDRSIECWQANIFYISNLPRRWFSVASLQRNTTRTTSFSAELSARSGFITTAILMRRFFQRCFFFLLSYIFHTHKISQYELTSKSRPSLSLCLLNSASSYLANKADLHGNRFILSSNAHSDFLYNCSLLPTTSIQPRLVYNSSSQTSLCCLLGVFKAPQTSTRTRNCFNLAKSPAFSFWAYIYTHTLINFTTT